MAKIMLVEDDNNLREIYEARLLAEGHEIISAHDGEEALAIAVREKPELIISDVMMPKISGFDMLDILRSSPETKNTKVIMMTALSQLEDKDRADRLGADRYLVKSQVTLEDVINVANEVLAGPADTAPTEPEPIAPIRGADTAQQAPTAPVSDPQPDPATSSLSTLTDTPSPDTGLPPAASNTGTTSTAADPVVPAPEPNVSTDPVPSTAAPAADASTKDSSAEESTPVAPAPETPAVPSEPAPTPEVTPQPTPTPEPVPAPTTEPSSEPTAQEPNSISIDADGQILNSAQTVHAEQGKVEEQINSFINSNPTGTPVAVPDPEAPVITAEETPAAPVATEAAPANTVPDGFIPDASPESTPVAPAPETPAVPSEPAPTPEVTPQPTPTPEPVPAPTTEPSSEPTAPMVENGPENTSVTSDPSSPSMPKKVIQPIGDPLAAPDLEALAAKEEEKEQVQKILTDAEINAAPQPAPEQNPDDPNAIAL